ncbi:MAG: hypothetical protein J0653_02650, partial [Deltaproteobacteria bacterium]|nr:hypothetical protein [Deltaproteobacteria bacterium]
CARMLGAGAMSPFDCFLVVMKSYQGKSRDYWLERREVYQPLLDSIGDVLAMDSCFAWESPDGLCIFTFDCQTQAAAKAEQLFKAQAIIRVIESHVPDLAVAAGIAERAPSLKDLPVHYQQSGRSKKSFIIWISVYCSYCRLSTISNSCMIMWIEPWANCCGKTNKNKRNF